MLKEIHEQAGAVSETLSHWRATVERNAAGGLAPRSPAGGESDHHRWLWNLLPRRLAGRIAIERWARIPVDVEVASEFRYRDPIIEHGTFVLGITQSGETADTLAAMRLARERGATVLAVTNAPASQATRESDGVLFTRAGLEIGVAATKTFVAQVVLLYALAIHLAAVRGSQSERMLPNSRRRSRCCPT